MPGGRVTAVLGVAASVFLAGNILLPFSPGALDGLEYALAAALAALGVLLYGFRDRTLSDGAREALIFGGACVTVKEKHSHGEKAGKAV